MKDCEIRAPVIRSAPFGTKACQTRTVGTWETSPCRATGVPRLRAYERPSPKKICISLIFPVRKTARRAIGRVEGCGGSVRGPQERPV
jgi:hypothetical protein